MKKADSELLLLSEIAEGSELAYSKFYKLYHPVVAKFVLKFIKSNELATDITQDIFVEFWTNRQELHHINSVKAYLFIVARNKAFNFLKRASREEKLKSEIIYHSQQLRNSIEEDLISEEYKDIVRELLTRLPSRTQEVFTLCREEEKSYEETALLLNISKSAVKKHMIRSIKHLKSALMLKVEIIIILIWILL